MDKAIMNLWYATSDENWEREEYNVSRLPRWQQQKVFEFVSAFVKQYEQNQQG
ncbi:MAG: hypothetical protein ACRD63_08885 [Pyrinomonadaceae bacterium]